MNFLKTQGKKRWLIFFLLGMLAGVGMLTGPYIKVASFIAFPLFLWLSDSLSSKLQNFLSSWGFAVGYFCVALYWVVVSLHVDLEKFFWLIPFSVLGLPALLASFFGIASVLIPWAQFKGISKIIFFASAWMLSELMRSYLFTGFPWALLGYIWEDMLPIAQLASMVGIFGVSLFSLGMLSAPYLWMTQPRSLATRTYTGLWMILFCLTYAWGMNRLTTYQTLPDQSTRMRLVQPSIPQTLKWDHHHEYQNLRKLMQLTAQHQPQDLKVVLWPEAAITFLMTPEVMKFVSQIVPSQGYLITGATRYTPPDLWTSLFVINSQGASLGIYDKHYLVPFGEYVPLRKILDQIYKGGVKKLTHGLRDYSNGTSPRYMNVSGIPPFVPLICYEIIYPGKISDSKGPQAKWIFNATNDAWFGDTAGPRQHLGIAQFRAIEEGLPLVRVANTGISAVISATGQILNRLEFNHTGVLDFELPGFIPPPSFFIQHKTSLLYGLIAFIILAILLAHTKQKAMSRNKRSIS